MNEKLVDEFTGKAEAVSAEVVRVKTFTDAYKTVLEIIREAEVKQVGSVDNGLCKGLIPLLREQGIEVVTAGSPRRLAELEVGVIPADMAIAETGTVAHDATDLFSRYFSMLCPTNIVLLYTASIKANMLEAIKALEINGVPPRYAAFITGPSRTADIERVLTIGVHGPGRLCVILIDEGECNDGGK